MLRTRSLVATLTFSMLALLISTSVALAAGGGNSLNAKACQKGGWETLVTTTGASFASEEACVSYAAKGGILKRAQTVNFTSTNPSPVLVGASYTPTATASSGLTAAITLDAASTGCSLASGVVSFTAAGTCVIDANQAGNATYNAAAQVQQSITVTVTPAQSACEFWGGTFGSAAGALWTCNGLPNATISSWQSFSVPNGLLYQCFSISHATGGFSASSINGGPWNSRCS
jgi:hypothetical protein